MELAFEIEDAAYEASALKSLLLATVEAAYNGSYEPGEYEEAFNFLYNLAFKHSKRLKMLEKEAFKLLKESRISETVLA